MTAPKPFSLPFGVIRDHLDSLIQAVPNLLERQWPTRWSAIPEASLVLQVMVRSAGNSYRSVVHLCADDPPDPARRLEFGLAAPPLARTVLDVLFNLVFLFQDLPPRIHWYHKAGWREVSEEADRYRAAYGNDPEWQEWLGRQARLIATMRADGVVSEQEATKPKSIPFWPTPGQMLKSKDLSDDRREFLQYLNDWFYRELSQDSHLSWPGLARRFPLVQKGSEAERHRVLVKQKSDAVLTTVTLLLAVLSEINAEIGYDLNQRLKFLWGVLNPVWGATKELYDLRYESRL